MNVLTNLKTRTFTLSFQEQCREMSTNVNICVIHPSTLPLLSFSFNLLPNINIRAKETQQRLLFLKKTLKTIDISFLKRSFALLRPLFLVSLLVSVLRRFQGPFLTLNYDFILTKDYYYIHRKERSLIFFFFYLKFSKTKIRERGK